MTDDPVFRMIKRALHYWQQQTRALDDAAALKLLPEQPQIWRWLRGGMHYPALIDASSSLMVNLFKVIDESNEGPVWCELIAKVLPLLPPDAVHRRIQMINHYGFFLRRGRNHRDGLAQHVMALDLACQHGLSIEEGDSAYHCAMALMDLRRPDEGLQMIARAQARFEALDPPPPAKLAPVLNVRGQLHMHSRDYSNAEACLCQALALFEQLDEPFYVARVYLNLANLALEQGRYEEAVEHCRAGLAQHPAPREEMLLYNTLGVAHYHIGDPTAAERHFLNTIDLGQRQVGDRYAYALATLNVGIIRTRAGRLDAAEPYIMEAERLFSATDDIYDRGNAWGMVGELRMAQGRLPEARDYLCKSVAELQKALELPKARREAKWFGDLLAEVERRLAAGSA